MARIATLLAALLTLGPSAHEGGEPPAAPPRLPALVFEDQRGRRLELAALRGRVVVIVYGDRHALQDHVAWGRKLDAQLRHWEVYASSDPPAERPVRILALAQMGGVPRGFRPIVRAALRGETPEAFSLWLDWEDRMSALFGSHPRASTVVVADRRGDVHLVAVGPPAGGPWGAVTRALHGLR